MVVPALKNKANMAAHDRGRESSGPNIMLDYPLIDWSNVPAPTMTSAPIMPATNSTRQINWEANCQFQERQSLHLDSADNRNDTMLRHCNDFFSSWRERAPPSDMTEPTNSMQERFQNVSPVDQQEFNDRPVTPPTPIPVTEIFSPNTVNEVRSTIRALFPNGPPPPTPVIPVKRYKKGDPYIVGCTKRPRVPEKKNLNVFKGDKYGITKDTNAFDDDECPAKRKRGKRKQYPNWSKSRFNPKSEEIAATFKRNENVDKMLDKPARNDTTAYMATPYTPRPTTFNPLPSTSKDNETIMKNEKQFSESLKLIKLNYACDDNEDDDDLPDVQWESKNITKNQRQSLFQSRNIELTCNEEPSVKSEDLNNNNSNTDEVDLCEIQFDSYMPRKEFPVPITTTTTTTNDPIVIDEIDLVNFIEPAKPKQEVSEILEVKDDYNSITFEDLYSVPKTTETIDVDDLLKDLRNFQHNKKPVSQDIITIVNPADLETSHHQKAQEHLKKNVPLQPNANRESIAEVIEIPESSGSIAPVNYRPSTSDIEFVSETIGSNRSNPTQTHSTGNDSDKDADTSIADSVYSAVFRELNGGCSMCVMPEVCNELISLHQSLTKYGEYLKSKSLTRLRRKNKQKISPQEQPQQSGTVNNENAAPSANGQGNSPTNGERRLGDCPICLDNLAPGAIASTTCGHVFCLSCIKKCLRTSGKKCPTCRKTLKGPGYHQVFL